METIGKQLKYIRKVRRKTIEDLSNETKIKKIFISRIEKEQWHLLPEYPVVLGFVKSISNALDLNTQNVVALLRRDYPPQQLDVNPKPEIKEEFRWGPRLTFLAGVTVVIVAIIGYLVFQYFRFLAPPKLIVSQPENNTVISTPLIEVSGMTDSDVSVTVNDQPAFVDDEGNFYTEIEVGESLSELEVIATTRSGQETKRTINVNIAKQ